MARLQQGASSQSTTQENVISIVMLKCVGAIEAYRKLSPTRVDRRPVLDFLLFQPNFPRSLRFCALEASELTQRLSDICRATDAAVGRSFGRLASRLENSDVDEVMAGGTDQFLHEVLADTGRASTLLQRSFFLQ